MTFEEYWREVFGSKTAAEVAVELKTLPTLTELRAFLTSAEAQAINRGARLDYIDEAHERATDILFYATIEGLLR